MTSPRNQLAPPLFTKATTKVALALGALGLAALLGWITAFGLSWAADSLADTLAYLARPYHQAIAALDSSRLK